MKTSHWRNFLSSFFRLLAQDVMSWPKSYIFRRPVFLILGAWILVILVLKMLGTWDEPRRNDPSNWNGQRVRLVGRVADLPDPRPRGCQYVLDVETLTPLHSYDTQSVHGKTQLFVMGSSTPIAIPGDRLRLTGVLQQPQRKNIPGVFDYGRYLAMKGIHSVMYTSPRFVDNTGNAGSLPLKRWGWHWRAVFLRTFDSHLTPEQASVMGGLVVGRRPRFHPTIKKIFIESGTMHILVASGSNVAFVVGLWFFLATVFLRLSRRLAMIGALPLIWIYVLVVGADPPIFRAGLMGSLMLISLLLSREDRLFHAWALAALVLLFLEPRLLFDLGFQMSFISVFGLLYFLPTIDPLFQKQSFVKRWLGRIGAATMTAQVWLFPITTSVFKKIYPISLIANMLVLPLSGLGLFLGFFMVFSDVLQHHIPFGFFLFSTMKFLTQSYAQTLIMMVEFLATTPGLGCLDGAFGGGILRELLRRLFVSSFY